MTGVNGLYSLIGSSCSFDLSFDLTRVVLLRMRSIAARCYAAVRLCSRPGERILRIIPNLSTLQKLAQKMVAVAMNTAMPSIAARPLIISALAEKMSPRPAPSYAFMVVSLSASGK